MKVKEILNDPRRRVILITIGAAVILLILLLILVVNALSGQPKNLGANEQSDIAISTPVEDNRLDPVTNSSDSVAVTKPSSTSTSSTSSASSTTSSTASELPSTGPESILPLTLIAGAATTLILSRKKSVL